MTREQSPIIQTVGPGDDQPAITAGPMMRNE